MSIDQFARIAPRSVAHVVTVLFSFVGIAVLLVGLMAHFDWVASLGLAVYVESIAVRMVARAAMGVVALRASRWSAMARGARVRSLFEFIAAPIMLVVLGAIFSLAYNASPAVLAALVAILCVQAAVILVHWLLHNQTAQAGEVVTDSIKSSGS